MDSMFEKLGTMLNQALESGKLPEEAHSKTNPTSVPKYTHLLTPNEILLEKEYIKTYSFNKPSFEQIKRNKIKFQDYSILKNNTILKTKKEPNIPPKVKTAFSILGVSSLTDIDGCRKAYRKKLKTFHPDNNSNNIFIQKIALEKTKQIVDAWNVIETFYNKK